MAEIESASMVEKPDFLRELGPVDIAQLSAIVSKVSENVWNREDEAKENKFHCFHHTQHIIFRFIEGMKDHRVSYSTPVWQAWQGILVPMMRHIIRPYGFQNPQFPKAMLARLKAGYGIDPHTDGAGSNLHTHKIHVPIYTNPKATFHIGGQDFNLERGHAYEVNNIKRHGVRNDGEEDRIHLIFEVFEGQD